MDNTLLYVNNSSDHTKAESSNGKVTRIDICVNPIQIFIPVQPRSQCLSSFFPQGERHRERQRLSPVMLQSLCNFCTLQSYL